MIARDSRTAAQPRMDSKSVEAETMQHPQDAEIEESFLTPQTALGMTRIGGWPAVVDMLMDLCTMVHSYLDCREAIMIEVERVQTGVRMEKRLLKVLKAFAELKDITLGDLLEGIVLHAFEGKAPFGKESLGQIGELKKIYGLALHARDSHKLKEKQS
jgi:hypothetical protein